MNNCWEDDRSVPESQLQGIVRRGVLTRLDMLLRVRRLGPLQKAAPSPTLSAQSIPLLADASGAE